jgi:hypothetical protein
MSNFVTIIGKTSSSGYENIIHINDDISKGNFFSKYSIYYCLEYGLKVGKFKKYNSGLKESFISFKGSFLLIFFFDSDIVISPSNIKLGKPILANKLANKLFNE